MTTLSDDTAAWSPARRVVFRFTFSFFALHLAPWVFSLFPTETNLWQLLTDPLVQGIARFVWPRGEVEMNPAFTDTSYTWVALIMDLALTLVAGVVWTALDGKRLAYTRLRDALRTVVRFFLVERMAYYGVAKVTLLQFGSGPGPGDLNRTFGDSPPMAVLWRFMAASPLYQFAGGAAETLGGVLLIFRRTTTLGAIATAVVMGNVVLLNLSYDVPVKLHGMFILLCALWLLDDDAARLWKLLVRHVPVEPEPLAPTRRAHVAAALVVATIFFARQAGDAVTAYELYGSWSSHPLYGLYSVEDETIDGEAAVTDIHDKLRWARVGFDGPGLMMHVRLVDGSFFGRWANVDSEQRTLTIASKKLPMTFHYAVEADGVVLDGECLGRKIHMRWKRLNLDETELRKRGFHWVSESPYNF